MEITNLSWNENLSKRFNNPLLPRSIRGLIVGKSGFGKTTLLLNLLLKPGWLDYDTLFVFGKSLFQPEYKILRTAFAEGLPKEYILRLFNMRDQIQSSQIPPTLLIKEWVSSLNKESDIKSYFFESASDVPDPRELNSEDKNLMIFDDLLLERQNKRSLIMYVVDIATSTVSILRRIILNYQGKLYVKTPTSYVYFDKI